MKATETSIRQVLQKYNIKAKELGGREYTLDILAKTTGNQQRFRYALMNGKGHFVTDFVSGQTILFYLQGILEGISLMVLSS